MLALLFYIPGSGPDTLPAVPATFFFTGLFSGPFLLCFSLFESVAEFLTGQKAILLARTLSLHFDFDLGRVVLEKNAG